MATHPRGGARPSGRSQELPFPRAEFDRRLRHVQVLLQADRLDGALLFDPANIYYLTGYQSIGYFTYQALLLPARGAPTLISRKVNQFLARVTPSLGEFIPVEDTEDPMEVSLRALRAGEGPGTLGVEMSAWTLTVPAFERLREQSGWKLVDWSGVVERQRISKSPREVQRIRRAARAAEAGLQAALEVLTPGATENDVAAAMHRASIGAGSEYLGHPPLVASGERSALCFATWRRRRLRRGDVVFLEAAGCVDRYHAILARTAVLGKPARKVRQVAEILIQALEAALAAIRPGVTSGEVDRACRGVIQRAGYGDRFVHRTAYSIGIGFPPDWGEGKTLALRKDDPTVLQPGMTFHVVPTIFEEDFGMGFSETVQVTARGCEVITRFPRQLVAV